MSSTTNNNMHMSHHAFIVFVCYLTFNIYFDIYGIRSVTTYELTQNSNIFDTRQFNLS
jgi:hypothetical protein